MMATPARIAVDLMLATSKAVVPAIGTAWQYAKVEMIPPMTHSFVHGAIGKNFEKSAAQFGQGIISGIEGRIKEMDMEVERVRKEKEAAIKAAMDQAAAAAKAAAQNKLDEKKRQDEAKAKEAQKPKEEKKPEAKAAAPPPAPKPEAKKAKPAKKKEPARKKEPKKNRRDEKKGKPPKK
ncbi:uncharacterized protein LOC106129364 [Amyelois transitella]|uniref:uncharacterized protein LOC106129364 n=1 Tax=Amyelois transitella TaxID=680683 RepID=UPI00067E49F4|nr:uncharacterized protein LOC106129364 [Amyelois transitella]